MFAKLDKSGEILTNRKKYGKYEAHKKIEGVLFGRKKNERNTKTQQEKYEELSGINDLDTNITKNNAISSTSLHLELQLENSEKKLKKLNNEKKENEILDIKNPQAAQKLQKEENRLKENIETYRTEYRKLGTSYKITDTITRTKNNAFARLSIIKAKLSKTPFFKGILLKIPLFKARQDVTTAKTLNNRLKKELSRPAKPEYKIIEHLLVKAERLTKHHTGTE